MWQIPLTNIIKYYNFSNSKISNAQLLKNGNIINSQTLSHTGNNITLTIPQYQEDIILKIIEEGDTISPSIPTSLNYMVIN
jgi:hypothetical protein